MDPSKPRLTFSKEFETSKVKYYDSKIHEAAFVLPGFARRVLESKDE
jgi:spermidine synthase